MKGKWLVIIILLLIVEPLLPLSIKIGSIAPAKSPWDKALRQLGREWKTISGGQIDMKIYPGGIAGSEDDMIRKMKVGILGGAVFTNRGLAKIYSDFNVLNIPFLFNSEEEFLFIVKKMNPMFEEKIEKKGYKVLLWSTAGWVNFFSEKKIEYPDDLKKHKLSFTTGEPELEQVWKRSGYQVIPNEINDLMMGLQSGMVNAFYLPPLLAASGQYFPLAPHMLSLKIAPLYGGIVLTRNIWDKIPDKFKNTFMEAAEKLSAKLKIETAALETDAIATMIKHGLKVNQAPEGSVVKWREASADEINALMDKVFSKAVFDQMMEYLNKYRKDNNDK